MSTASEVEGGVVLSDLAKGFSSLENRNMKLWADFLGAQRAEYSGSSPSNDNQAGEDSRWQTIMILPKTAV